MKSALLLAALACTLSACAGASVQPVTIDVALRGAHYRLPNGLEVVIHQDKALPDVAVDVRYHVGSKDDPAQRSGFAHLFEHLMFLGSKKVSEDDFARMLNDAGAEYNAHTNVDHTEYYEVVPPAQVPVALWLEAERMAHPLERLTQETFTRERDVVKNEWRQRYDNVAYGHVNGIVRAAIFPDGHPYHQLPIGRVEDLDHASLEEAKAFAARWYQPANATLVIAGDVDLEPTRALVDKLFGSIPAGEPLPAPKRYPFPKLAKDRRIEVVADVEAPRVVIAWPLPPPYTPGNDEVAIAARTIKGWTTYKLTKENKVARSVDWSLQPGRLGSVLSIIVDLEKGASPEAAVSAIETRVAWTSKLGERGWRDFPDMRTQTMSATVLGLTGTESRASQIQDYLQRFGTPDAAQTDLRRIQSITAEQASAAVEQLLADSGKVVVVVKPTPGAPRGGKVAP